MAGTEPFQVRPGADAGTGAGACAHRRAEMVAVQPEQPEQPEQHGSQCSMIGRILLFFASMAIPVEHSAHAVLGLAQGYRTKANFLVLVEIERFFELEAEDPALVKGYLRMLFAAIGK